MHNYSTKLVQNVTYLVQCPMKVKNTICDIGIDEMIRWINSKREEEVLIKIYS